MKIKVTQEHIDFGSKHLIYYSPISLACEAIWPGVKAAVMGPKLWIDFVPIAEVPVSVIDFLIKFNDYKEVKPFDFEIKIPFLVRMKLWKKF